MKILHILYSGLGGHGNVFFSMVDADKNHDIAFEALFNGVEEVKAEYVEKCTEKKLPWHFVKKKPGLDIRYLVRVYRAIKASKPQIIFLHGCTAVLPAKLAKITTPGIKKIIVRETQANHLKTTSDWLYLSTAMLFADKMVFLTPSYREEVKTKLNWLFREKNCTVIPNGINLDTFKPAGTPNPAPVFYLGMQSRLTAIKDHLTLVEAFALLLDKQLPVKPHLLIAGEGSCKDALIKKAAACNISDSITFTGLLGETELVTFLQKLNMYIHASLGETMSTAIMQAMACGKTIIASDVPGISNMIVHDETGLLVPPKNAEALCDAVLQLINNPKKAKMLADNAYRFAANHYSNTIMLQRYLKIFND